ncbi:LegC family aminotransferase [Candidatus Synechococcus calcipolaris G9]|uniref:LegC family aminotransferase n=1 Tax=Candidatus Synechococcus calcipolaris G9 TaxID=1497997 RepID=A0ABT6EWT1_9SYNE|nr:LegC family aminotransferase [Candidatus Synechococcus calcipolaris]MDG2989568.1 LegC family aminotransferase [Candidatus Synechococcus calcipolaris G9]
MDTLESNFLAALDQVLGKPSPFIPLHEPEFGGREREFLNHCIDSTFVSSVGQYVDQFEAQLAEFTGAKAAIAVVNGTAALHIALLLAGVTPGDEVLVPALSFVATANAVAHCGAIPHFVDSEFSTLGLDPLALQNYLERIAQVTPQGLINKLTQRRIAAIIPMHTYGHPVSLGPLLHVAKHYQLPVIEDAAESLGSTYQGTHTGTLGLAGILSFNGNKIITTGGGGAILTNHQDLANQAKHLTTTAKQPHRWEFFHDHVGWNYRLPNLNAALGCAQLMELPMFLEKKRQLAQAYQDIFKEIEGINFIHAPENCLSNYWLNTIQLTQPSREIRDRLLTIANDAGFQCRPTWTLLHRLPMYTHCPRAPLPVAEQLEVSLINLPSSPKLVTGLRD